MPPLTNHMHEELASLTPILLVLFIYASIEIFHLNFYVRTVYLFYYSEVFWYILIDLGYHRIIDMIKIVYILILFRSVLRIYFGSSDNVSLNKFHFIIT